MFPENNCTIEKQVELQSTRDIQASPKNTITYVLMPATLTDLTWRKESPVFITLTRPGSPLSQPAKFSFLDDMTLLFHRIFGS